MRTGLSLLSPGRHRPDARPASQRDEAQKPSAPLSPLSALAVGKRQPHRRRADAPRVSRPHACSRPRLADAGRSCKRGPVLALNSSAPPRANDHADICRSWFRPEGGVRIEACDGPEMAERGTRPGQTQTAALTKQQQSRAPLSRRSRLPVSDKSSNRRLAGGHPGGTTPASPTR
jgi:hypothetical protein